MELRISRDGALLFQSSAIIEWSFDGLSVSGVDYWSQEARQAKIKLFYDATLSNLLEGSSREIVAGFHTLAFSVLNAGQLLFAGVLAEGDFSLEYTSLNMQNLELNLLDYFGLLIRLAADRQHQVASSMHPVNILPSLIASCFSSQSDAEVESSAPASVLRLTQALGVISWQGAADSYQPGDWLPWRVQNYEIYNCNSDKFTSQWWNEANDVTLGLWYNLQGELYIYFSQYVRWSNPNAPMNIDQYVDCTWLEMFRVRIYRLDYAHLTLAYHLDLANDNPQQPINASHPNNLFQLYYGVCDYRVSGDSIFYSGQFALDNVETVPGWYNCKELLAECLKISHAVMLNSSGEFSIRNRIDENLPLVRLIDPITASLDEAESPPKPSSSPVAITSLALLEAVDRYYGYYLAARGLSHEAEIVLLDSQLSALICVDNANPPQNPYDLINYRLSFDGRTIYPKEIDYDISTGEITYRGWC